MSCRLMDWDGRKKKNPVEISVKKKVFTLKKKKKKEKKKEDAAVERSVNIKMEAGNHVGFFLVLRGRTRFDKSKMNDGLVNASLGW